MNKVRIGLIFSAVPPETRTWPYVGYNYEERARQILRHLRDRLKNVELTYRIVYSREEAKQAVDEMRDVVGYVIYYIGIWSGITDIISGTGKPLVLIDDLYAGSGEFILALAELRSKNYPVIGVASSNMDDIADAIRLLKVLGEFSQSKILVVADYSGSRAEHAEKLAKMVKERYGLEIVYVSSETVREKYNHVSEREAEEIADKWIKEAERVVEPARKEIVKSAKIYLALKELMKEHAADAVTVDCLTLVYSGRLPAYPCLAFFQFNNDGYTATCEADIDSTATMLLLRYLTGRPSFVSDPVIDQASQQIIYAHCVAPTRIYGPQGPASPYRIRSHAEDRKGASIQALLPSGKTVTTAKILLSQEELVVHTAVTMSNGEEEKACRTKLAAKTNVDRILENWKPSYGWHRVTVFGDYRRQLINLGKLLRLKITEEDK